MIHGHRFGRARAIAAALATLALLQWTGDADAGVKVVAGDNGDQPASLSGGKTITIPDGSGKSTGSNKLVPPAHTVKKGDTLWDICDTYFSNPWQWPRVWSYNPEILNPHWIYPGEVIRLKKEGSLGLAGGGGTGSDKSGLNGGTGSPMSTKSGMSLKPKLVPSGTVFLQNGGFLYDSDYKDTGEITGSPEDKMLLSQYDRVYVRVSDEQAKNLAPGDTLTIYRSGKNVKTADGKSVGNVVQILGTVKVSSVDKDKKLVEGTITESRDTVDRGDRVGPIERKLDVVSPTTNGVDLKGTILASLTEHEMYGANQVVLIDKGEKDGLKPGNRLFVVRKGDPWQKGLSSTGALSAGKISLSEKGPPDVTPQEGKQSEDYPEEVVAEIRVIRTRKETATCLVTQSRLELQSGDVWVAKKGY